LRNVDLPEAACNTLNMDNSSTKPIPATTTPYNSRILPMVFVGIVMLFVGLIGGYFIFPHQSSQKQNMPVNSNTAQIIPTVTSIVTSNSSPSVSSEKTYSNTVYGISFQYPYDGAVSENEIAKDNEITLNTKNLQILTSADIQNPRSDNIGSGTWYDLTFKIYDNPQNTSLAIITANTFSKATKTTPVMIGTSQGILGSWASSDTGDYTETILSHNGRIYVFEMTADNGSSTYFSDKVLQEIISTANFTQ